MTPSTSDKSFQKDVLDAPLPVLVDFWAPWCGPCRSLSPIIDRLHELTEGQALVYKLNVDENPAIASEFGIRSVPTILVFTSGAETARLTGIQHPEKYLQALGLEMA